MNKDTGQHIAFKGKTLARRLERFYLDNPLEELTIADAQAKFNVSEAWVRESFKELIIEGFIERSVVYRKKI